MGVHVWWVCKQLVGGNLCALLSLPSSPTPAIRATQEVRGQGQPAIPDQGYLLLLNFFFFFFFCNRQNQRQGRRQDHMKPEFLPESKSANENRRAWGEGGPGEGCPERESWG